MNNKEKVIFNDFNEYMHMIFRIQEKLRDKKNFNNIYSLSNTALSVIMYIPKEGSRNYKEITENLKIPKSTLTGIASKLKSSGYVIEKVNKQDKRMHDLFLTEKGKLAQHEHDACEKEVYSILTGSLNLKEKEQLLSILKKGLCYK